MLTTMATGREPYRRDATCKTIMYRIVRDPSYWLARSKPPQFPRISSLERTGFCTGVQLYSSPVTCTGLTNHQTIHLGGYYRCRAFRVKTDLNEA